MNAPTPAAALAPASFESIALSAITPSQTPLQQLRRAHFKEPALAELGESIKTQGVLQPILVRPSGKTIFELVAGERRWIGAQRAGLTEIPAIVCQFTDGQVIEAQLVENLQREDGDALYEAEGYHALMEEKQITAEAVAALIGKSRSYVYARLKLRELCPEARAALDAGELDASKALLIARFKGPKLQQQALRRLGNSPQYSYQAAVATLRDQFMVDLALAPFALDDAEFPTLHISKGKEGWFNPPACTACPHYSRNDAELQASFDADAHICTDRGCYDAKVAEAGRRKVAEALAAGRTVLTGEEALAALPPAWHGVSAEYVDLDAESDQKFPEPEPKATGDDAVDDAAFEAWQDRLENWTPPTYRNLLDGAAVETTLAWDKDNTLHELAPVKATSKLLKAKGITLHIPQPQRELPGTETPDRREEEARQEARREREQTFRRRIVAEIRRKWKGPLKQPELHRLADIVIEQEGADDSILNPFGGEDIKTGNLKEADLTCLLALLSVSRCVYYVGDDPGALFALAKRFKIDPTKIKKDLAAETREKDKPAAGAKPAKKKPGK